MYQLLKYKWTDYKKDKAIINKQKEKIKKWIGRDIKVGDELIFYYAHDDRDYLGDGDLEEWEEKIKVIKENMDDVYKKTTSDICLCQVVLV